MKRRRLLYLLAILTALAAAGPGSGLADEDSPADASDPRARVDPAAMKEAPKARIQEEQLGPTTSRFSIAAPPGRRGHNVGQIVFYLVCPSARRTLEHGFRSFSILGLDLQPGVGGALVAEFSPAATDETGWAGMPIDRWIGAAKEDETRVLRQPLNARNVLLSCHRLGIGTEFAMADVPTEYGETGVPEPGVRIGGEWLRRALFSEVPELDAIVSLTWRPCQPEGPAEWVVGANSGVAFLAGDGAVRATLAFDRRVGTVVPVDQEGDGTCEFMNRGGGWAPVSLHDAAGRTLWRYPTKGLFKAAANTMAAGDLDGDGRLEFVVGMNARGGLVALEDDGTEKWTQKAANVFSVEVADLDGDGAPEILHSQGVERRQDGRGIWLRKADGTPIGVLPLGRFLDFSLVPWPTADARPYLFGVHDSVLQLRAVDPDGTLIASFIAPRGGFDRIAAAPVRLAPGRPPYLAAIRVLGGTIDRSSLLVFDPAGDLLYVEVLPHHQAALAVEGSGEGGPERLLVGVGDRIWKYGRLTRPSPAREARPPGNVEDRRPKEISR